MVEKRNVALRTAALSEQESQALQAFANRIRQSFPSQIRRMALFGSKARGDSRSDSDIDVLVILNREDRLLRRKIIAIASEIALEYDVLLSPKVTSEERWERKQDFGLYRNIAHDAVPIPTERK